jgi:HD-GYP domain-containing protein (c-di-GMP phosphodiesterase class II)/CHASE1-domain containing sensor protein
MGKGILRRAFQVFGLSGRVSAILMTLCIGLALTLGLFAFVNRWEHRQQQAEFDYVSEPFVDAIRKAAESIELTHEVLRQDFYGSREVSREEFSLCAEPCLARLPSLKVLQWAPRVTEKDRSDFERLARNKGRPKYRIIEPDSKGQLIPAKPRTDHYPIWYAATKCGFGAKFGWDFAADPRLLSVINQCRDTNRFGVSERIDLSKIGMSPLVVQTLLPVYRDFKNVRTLAQRRSHFEGLLVGLCQLDDLVNGAVGDAKGHQGIDFALYDESAPGGGRLLYCHESRSRDANDQDKNRTLEGQAETQTSATGVCHKELLNFGGRQWSLVCNPAPHFFAAHPIWRSWAILTVGLTVTCLMVFSVWSVVSRTERIERLVAERTLDLRKKDDLLRQAIETKAKAIRLAHEETIYRLVGASMCRDEETGMHVKRTGMLSEALALAAGWSAADAETLRLAAPMHDVGKIGIPDAILQKPGKLTAEEFEVMKTHSRIGAGMLDKSQSEILAMARDIAMCHHERWDGSGYPLGLAGTAIPESARIVSVVDVFDALSHDRVYRPALPDDEVTKILMQGAGKQFDPRLLSVFLAHYKTMTNIVREYPDESKKINESSAPLASPAVVPVAMNATVAPVLGTCGR